MDLFKTDIKFLKGVGEFRATLLRKLGINTINDLLEYFPRDYIERQSSLSIAELETGRRASLTGRIISINKRSVRNRQQLNVIISDGNDELLCTWFRFGKWLTEQLQNGSVIWISGVIGSYRGRFQIIHPEIEVLDSEEDKASFWHNRSVLPVYSLTDKLNINLMRKLIYNAFNYHVQDIEETLSEDILEKFGWLPRRISLQKIHFSKSPEKVSKHKDRYAFEELFYNQIMLARVRMHHKEKESGIAFELKKTLTTRLKNSLPFRLTSAQKKVLWEIVEDMSSRRQMNRLLQGDVGSGKTIVTLFAMLLAVENGYQAVLMAPTEILAEQHYRSISLYLHDLEIPAALLKGGRYKGKKKIKELIKNGDIKIVIGTHALLQKDVEFAQIGFIAIDEQHRFGVVQRSLIPQKGNNPDLMYMSATPIPRSLALTVYGDLSVSVIDELPPGRKEIRTIWRGKGKREEAYNNIRNEIKKGRQAYIVCPLVEESEKIELLDAETLYVEVKNRLLPRAKAAILHGRMKAEEKDEIMLKFKQHEIDILVSTTVIEVGIDVSNATVMVIEHAERFGLSQLHQLRGRVGRGSSASYCYLISYPPLSAEGAERLQTMVLTNDGFEIAEKDLELRGPGDFFGTAQSGMKIFKHANIVRDHQLLIQARAVARWILENDPELIQEKNINIKQIYNHLYLEKENLFDF